MLHPALIGAGSLLGYILLSKLLGGDPEGALQEKLGESEAARKKALGTLAHRERAQQKIAGMGGRMRAGAFDETTMMELLMGMGGAPESASPQGQESAVLLEKILEQGNPQQMDAMLALTSDGQLSEQRLQAAMAPDPRDTVLRRAMGVRV